MLTTWLAVVAAVTALGDPLKRPWLVLVGLIVAAVGSLGILLIDAQKARLESKRERAELDRRFKVPVVPITQIEPTQIGVDPAATKTVLGETVPEYVRREIDAELRGAIEAALTGERWMLVLVGASKVGKSRTLYEALSACSAATRLQVVAPADGGALRSLLDPGRPMATRPKQAVLWLDDLEPFLAQGVTLQMLQEWRSRRPGWIVAATYGGKGSELVAEAATGGLKTLAADILQHARQIPLHSTSNQETDSLRGRLSDADLDAVRRHGLAAFFVAGPALQRKLASKRHALGEPECPEGVAVVRAAVDWARCGRTDPIGRDTLRALWPDFLQAGTPPNDDRFAIGLEWALRPVAATIALLQDDHGYQAYDYAIRLVNEQPAVGPPRGAVWTAAIGTATAEEAAAVAVAAYAYSRLDETVAALQRAKDSSNFILASWAKTNLGGALGTLGRLQEALTVSQQVIDDYGDDPDPWLRERVVKALNNVGVTLGKLGYPQEALAAYQQVFDDYGDDPSPVMREQVAGALNGRGSALAELARMEEALAVFRQVIDDYGDDPNPGLSKAVARALSNRAGALGQLGRLQEALAVSQQVIDDYGGDAGQREQVFRALFNRAGALAKLGFTREALVAYQQVIDDCGDGNNSDVRELAANALDNRGAVLRELGRTAEALAAFQQVIDDYCDDPDPGLRELVANALNNQSVALRELGRTQEALAVHQKVIDDYGDDPNPRLGERVARALNNRGVVLMDELGSLEEALALFQQIIDNYGDDPNLGMRERVAMALNRGGVARRQLGRPQEALAAYQQVIDNYGDDPNLGMREEVARALNNRGGVLGQLGRPQEALAAYQQVIDNYGDDPNVGMRKRVARALNNRGIVLADELGSTEEALAVFRRVIDNYGHDPSLGEEVERATSALDELRGTEGPIGAR
jgi:tetratricopeptide (TPR) repeat protein